MIRLGEECIKCTHHKTCKYSELYNKFYEEIENQANNLEHQYEYDGYNIDFTCQYFSSINTKKVELR